jgi:hypothetical protein
LSRSLWRLWTCRRHCQQRHIPAQLCEFLAARSAGIEVGLEARALVSLQRPQRVEGEVLRKLFVRAHS